MLRLSKPYGYVPIRSKDRAKFVVFRALKRLKIPYTITKAPGEGFAWDGVKFNFKGVRPSDILHHLAHWMVATPEQRKLPEFGLGDGFDTGARVLANRARLKKFIEKNETGNEQEEMASLLGILMEKQFKLSWKITYREHAWDECDFEVSVTDTLDKLFMQGLIGVGGKVRFRV